MAERISHTNAPNVPINKESVKEPVRRLTPKERIHDLLINIDLLARDLPNSEELAGFIINIHKAQRSLKSIVEEKDIVEEKVEVKEEG